MRDETTHSISCRKSVPESKINSVPEERKSGGEE